MLESFRAKKFCQYGVTFREGEPFYGEPTDLSLLFEELDHLHSVVDGHEGEKVVSRTQDECSNTDDNVQVQVRPIVGTIQIGSLEVPVRDRWPQNLLVYSRRQPHG